MHGNVETPKMQALELKRHWQVIRRQNPLIGIREAAYILDLSEAELLATCCGEGVTRLRAPWEDLLKQILKAEAQMFIFIKCLVDNLQTLKNKQGL